MRAEGGVSLALALAIAGRHVPVCCCSPAASTSRSATAKQRLPVLAMRRWLTPTPHTVKVVTCWGGLRGGISVALALSLPAGPHRDTILALTYCVVVFSILGQGLTIGRVVRRNVTGS